MILLAQLLLGVVRKGCFLILAAVVIAAFAAVVVVGLIAFGLICLFSSDFRSMLRHRWKPQPRPMPDSIEEQPLTAKTIEELEIEDGELLLLKEKLTTEKRCLQAEIVGINNKCTRTLPREEFNRLTRLKGDIVRQLITKDNEIAEVNTRRIALNTFKQVRKQQAGWFPSPAIRQLVEMRDRLHAISMDKKRHQKAREIAWEISQELKELLKPHFENKHHS